MIENGDKHHRQNRKYEQDDYVNVIMMNDKEKTSKYYVELDSLFHKIIAHLNNYEKSIVLQNYFFEQFQSFVYATLIDNFFKNLNQKNIEELNLPQDKIDVINKEYEPLRKTIKSIISFSSKEKLDDDHYNNFKSGLKDKFPDFIKILSEVERLTSIKDLSSYLNKKKREIEEAGKTDSALETIILTKALEEYVNNHHDLPPISRLGDSLKPLALKSLKVMSQEIAKNLEKDRPRMLKEHRKIREGFEDRLYKRWKGPLDLLESLIVICLESGEAKKKKLSKNKNIVNPKQVALIKIHVRSIQIAYEIMALIRAGFADGAHARWRSLHELGIITFFLRENSDEVSERYLVHNVMKRFKAAEHYQKHHKALGYPPMTRKESDTLEKEHKRLLQKYGNDFEYRNGFEWIPRSIIANPSFKSLEEHVKLDKFYPFYSWASDSVHGGIKRTGQIGTDERS